MDGRWGDGGRSRDGVGRGSGGRWRGRGRASRGRGDDGGSRGRGSRGRGSATSRGQTPCLHWAKGNCRNGDSCQFSHDQAKRERQSQVKCHFFAAGSCKNGSNCPYSHDLNEGMTAGAVKPVPRAFGSASGDVSGSKAAFGAAGHAQPTKTPAKKTFGLQAPVQKSTTHFGQPMSQRLGPSNQSVATKSQGVGKGAASRLTGFKAPASEGGAVAEKQAAKLGTPGFAKVTRCYRCSRPHNRPDELCPRCTASDSAGEGAAVSSPVHQLVPARAGSFTIRQRHEMQPLNEDAGDSDSDGEAPVRPADWDVDEDATKNRTQPPSVWAKQPLETPQRVATPKKEQRSKTEHVTVVGTCMTMCPELELSNRVMSWLECEGMRPHSRTVDPDLAVKVYCRPAPMVELDLPEILRPLPVLQKTMAHLGSTVVELWGDEERVNLSEATMLQWGQFLQDRCRQVLQDRQIQRLEGPGAVEIVEQVVRVYLLVGHHLAASDEFQINKKLHVEQRDKALMTLHSLYVRGRDTQPTGSYPREPEFWAYSILLKLGGQVDNLLRKLPAPVLNHPDVASAIELHVLFEQQFFCEFFDKARKLSLLGACALHHHLPRLRRWGLECLHVAHHGTDKRKPSLLPISTVARVLGLSSEDDVIDLLTYDGVDVTEHGVMFSSATASDFSEAVTSHAWIYSLQGATRLGSIILSGQALCSGSVRSRRHVPPNVTPIRAVTKRVEATREEVMTPPSERIARGQKTGTNAQPPTEGDGPVTATTPPVQKRVAVDIAAILEGTFDDIIGEMIGETVRELLIEAQKARQAARAAERERRIKIIQYEMTTIGAEMLGDAVAEGVAEAASDTFDESVAEHRRFKEFRTKQCLLKWQRTSQVLRLKYERMEHFRRAQLFRKWTLATKYAALMRDFPTGLPPKSVQQPTALRGGPFQKPALINLVNSSRLQVEVKRRRVDGEVTRQMEEPVDVPTTVARILREKNPHVSDQAWKLCVAVLRDPRNLSRKQDALPRWLQEKLGCVAGPITTVCNADDPATPTVRVTVGSTDATWGDEGPADNSFAEALHSCSALITVVEYPGKDGCSLAYRSAVASQWHRIADCLSPGTQIPVVIVHDWPNEGWSRQFDFSRLLCPDGIWPPTVQDGTHVRTMLTRGQCQRNTVLNDVVRLCAARSWSIQHTAEQQLSAAELFDILVARNEPIQRFFRCTESWTDAAVDVGPLVRQLNFCGSALVDVVEAACAAPNRYRGGGDLHWEESPSNIALVQAIRKAVEEARLEIPDGERAEPGNYAKIVLTRFGDDTAVQLILRNISKIAVEGRRHAWQRVLAVLASAIASHFAAYGLRVPVTRRALPRLIPTWFLKLNAEDSLQELSSSAIVTPKPKSLIRRRTSEDHLLQPSDPSTEAMVVVPIDLEHARKRRHVDSLLEEATARVDTFSEDLARLVAAGALPE